MALEHVSRCVRASAACLGLLAVACGPTLRTVPMGVAPTNGVNPLIVDYPPPPAEVEMVPPDPGKPCAWQDGHWDWVGQRWQWQNGGWVVPPAGCHYAAPVIVWVPSSGQGELYYRPAHWYPDDPDHLSQAQILARCQKLRWCVRASDNASGKAKP